MFVDEKKAGEAQTKADPFTLESLIAWLEKQPANMTYEYMNCAGMCLLGQYMTSIGVDWFDGPIEGKSCSPYSNFVVKFKSRGIEIQNVASSAPYTIGGALKRARHLQARS